jgi:hypothetical protein
MSRREYCLKETEPPFLGIPFLIHAKAVFIASFSDSVFVLMAGKYAPVSSFLNFT